jgi:hypothetical protein
MQLSESINRICDELRLPTFVREKCIEMSINIGPKQDFNITKPIANTIACSIVSIVHKDAHRKGRVRHLPDKMIGAVFGLRTVVIVYNKRLINSVISGDSLKIADIIDK